MIKAFEGDGSFCPDAPDPFLTKIRSLYDCYGTQYDFARFYTQFIKEKPVSYLSLFEGNACLYLTADSDFREIEEFVWFSGGASVIYNAEFPLEFNSGEEIKGDVLQYNKRGESPSESVTEPDIKAVYEVLKSCEAEDYAVPDYLPFLSDMTHRKNMGKCALSGIEKDGVLVSCAMTVSETKNAVVIGAVGTRPQYRRQGLSRQVVIALSEKYAARNRCVFVFSSNEYNTRFYENAGFEKVYRFIEKRMG